MMVIEAMYKRVKPTQLITNSRLTSRPVMRATTSHGRTRTSFARPRALSLPRKRSRRMSRSMRRRKSSLRKAKSSLSSGEAQAQQSRKSSRRPQAQAQQPKARRKSRRRPRSMRRRKSSRRLSSRRHTLPRRVCASLAARWKVARCRWRRWRLCTASTVSWR
jgi:hypothetical protein